MHRTATDRRADGRLTRRPVSNQAWRRCNIIFDQMRRCRFFLGSPPSTVRSRAVHVRLPNFQDSSYVSTIILRIYHLVNPSKVGSEDVMQIISTIIETGTGIAIIRFILFISKHFQ